MQRVLERHGQLLRRFTELGGPGFEDEVRGRLQVLGLGETDMERPMAALSGGQRKLVALGACLIQPPTSSCWTSPKPTSTRTAASGWRP
jgi:ATPase subunit of ABC transporter with duplicated ATPase domains